MAYPSFLVAGIKEALACIVLGSIIGTAIYGVTVLQTYIYYRRYALSDTLPLKALVGVLFLLDTTTSALAAQSMYRYTVSSFGALLEGEAVVIPSLAVENAVTVLIGTIVQCYFAHTIWRFSGNTTLAIIICVFSISALGLGIAITVDLITESRDIFSFTSLKSQFLVGFGNGISGVCDIVIAGGLWYYLRANSSNEFASSRSMMDRLMLYAIQRGLLTAICQLMHMLMTVALPRRFFFIPFAFAQGKLYCNTFLATLNVRKSLRGSKDSEHIEFDTDSPARRDRESGYGLPTRLLETVPRTCQGSTNDIRTLAGSALAANDDAAVLKALPLTTDAEA